MFFFWLRLRLIGITNMKIFNNFWKIIKSKSIIPFLVFIPADPFNLVLHYSSASFSIKDFFNFLFFFIINDNRW